MSAANHGRVRLFAMKRTNESERKCDAHPLDCVRATDGERRNTGERKSGVRRQRGCCSAESRVACVSSLCGPHTLPPAERSFCNKLKKRHGLARGPASPNRFRRAALRRAQNSPLFINRKRYTRPFRVRRSPPASVIIITDRDCAALRSSDVRDVFLFGSSVPDNVDT